MVVEWNEISGNIVASIENFKPGIDKIWFQSVNVNSGQNPQRLHGVVPTGTFLFSRRSRLADDFESFT